MYAPAQFPDRSIAGRLLADQLVRMRVAKPIVLALPRGGVPVALEIAKALGAPLDLLLVRKIGVPWQPELAAGAVVDGEQTDIVLNEDVVAASDIGPAALQKLAQEELGEIERRRNVYLRGRTSMSVAGRSAIVVDDGIATGASVRAALTAVRRRSPKRLILAVPVAPTETLVALRPLVDDLLCLATPDPFDAIGAHYRDFHQLTDREVVEMLNQAPAEENAGAA